MMKATVMDPLKLVITDYLWCLAFAIELSVCLSDQKFDLNYCKNYLLPT